jgi:hypothetical protein
VSRARAKGTSWETKVIEYLRQWWPYAERRALHGAADKGDVSGIVSVCIECKSHASWKPGEWLRELDAEMANAAADTGAVFAKVKGKAGAADGVILLRPDVYVALLKAAGF